MVINKVSPEHLRVLIAFAETSNLVEAARRLSITQPAMSQRLARLQSEVDLPLFSRSGRRKTLSHFGKAFYELAKATESRFASELELLNRRYGSEANLTLRVGGRRELFSLFARDFSFGGRLDFSELHSVEAALLEDRVDLGLTRDLPGSPELAANLFFEGPSRLVLPAIRKRPQSLRAIGAKKAVLESSPCILHRKERSEFEAVVRKLGLNARKIRCKAELEDWGAIAALAGKGEGWTVLPAFVEASDTGWLEIPHAMVPRTSVYSVYRASLLAIPTFKKALSFSIRTT